MGWKYSRVTSVQAGEKNAAVYLNAAITHYEEKRYGSAYEFVQEAVRLGKDSEMMAAAHVYEVLLCRHLGKIAQADELVKAYDNYYFRQYLSENPAVQQEFDKKSSMGYPSPAENGEEKQLDLEQWLDDNDFIGLDDKVWGNTPLHVAVEQGNAYVCAQLLEHKADIDAKNKTGKTPLLVSVEKDNMQLVELLIENGADVDVGDNDGVTPLIKSVMDNNIQITELLAEKGAKVSARTKKGITPLHIAVCDDNRQIIDILLNNGADITKSTSVDIPPPLWLMLNPKSEDTLLRLLQILPNLRNISLAGMDLLQLVVQRNLLKVFRYLLKNGYSMEARDKKGNTLLHIAALHGSLDILQFLVKHGVDVNAVNNNRDTVLNLADKCTNLEKKGKCVEYLLNNNARGRMINAGVIRNSTTWVDTDDWDDVVKADDVDLVAGRPQYEYKDNWGCSLLHRAAKYNAEKICKYLLKCGAYIECTDGYGNTPLHRAVEYGSHQVCKILLDEGANVSAKNYMGMTPLHIAAMKDYAGICRVLIAYGADINALNRDNKKALAVAIGVHANSAAEVIRDAGMISKVKNRSKR